MRKTFTLLLIASCFAAAAPTSAPQSKLFITHVTVIDTETGKEATDQTVAISEGKISDVAKSKNVTVPANARTVNGQGKYLIPGLWDMHVHAVFPERIDSMFPMFVANGVLGIRDMGTSMSLAEIAQFFRRC